MSNILDTILGMSAKPKTEYLEAPEVLALSEKLIDEYGFVDASVARIKYLLKVSDKSKYNGRISKAGPKWKHISGFDYVLEVWQPFWEKSTPLEKRALLYHELSHIRKEEGKKGVKWLLEDHPIEAFPEEIKMFGPWSPQLKEAEAALADFAISPPLTFADTVLEVTPEPPDESEE